MGGVARRARALFLDELFTRFDELAADAGVEKIKTVGDEYMAVAGAPEPRADRASAAIRLGRSMLGALEDASRRQDAPLQLRIGLASGPLVGGVIGQQRILFDLWGDTVNTASRMQSSGVPGRIHVARRLVLCSATPTPSRSASRWR
jgi:class 3 adenylate cyclase